MRKELREMNGEDEKGVERRRKEMMTRKELRK
jgi:hypothetical protein